MSWLTKIWPFKKVPEKTETEFQQLIAESKARTVDLEEAAERLRKNREDIHDRAKKIIGDANGFGRQALKSTPG